MSDMEMYHQPTPAWDERHSLLDSVFLIVLLNMLRSGNFEVPTVVNIARFLIFDWTAQKRCHATKRTTVHIARIFILNVLLLRIAVRLRRCEMRSCRWGVFAIFTCVLLAQAQQKPDS